MNIKDMQNIETSFPSKGVVTIIDPRKNTMMIATVVLTPSTLGVHGPYKMQKGSGKKWQK